MKNVRTVIGGLGNLMFKQAYLWAQAREGAIPNIYVQSSKYWAKYTDEIKQMFGEGIVKNDKVSLHIRRGDYINNPFYVDLWETDYYKKAIAMFPDDKFIVFCRDTQGWEQDKADRQWCRDNLTPLLGDRFELPPKENTEIDDFNLMSGCKAHIIANSSFSWWASFLSDGLTIAPKQWFTDKVKRVDLLPNWIQL